MVTRYDTNARARNGLLLSRHPEPPPGKAAMAHTTRSGFPVYGRTPRDLLRDPNLSFAAKTVFGLLEDYSSPESPRPFPSAGTLAEFCGCSDKTVRRALSELREAGWIAVVARANEDGSQTSNEYVLCPGPEVDTNVPPGHERLGGVVTTVQGPWSPVSNEEEPDEAEPDEAPASNETDSQTPTRTESTGWEEVDEPVRQTVVAITRTLGLGPEDRVELVPVVAEALRRGTPQGVHDTATAGSMNGSRDPVRVVAHRLEQGGAKKPGRKLKAVR